MIDAILFDAILFDADGVLQLPSPKRRELWRERLGPEADLDAFVRDIFAAEHPAVTGSDDFAAGLAPVLDRWGWPESVQDAVDSWALIEIVPEMHSRVRALREAGTACHLASNQEPNRARHMSESLGYRELFEREFYSCHMGVMKPEAAYFRQILQTLDLPPERVLFLDDKPANVAGAADLGIHAVRFDLGCMDANDFDAIVERYGYR